MSADPIALPEPPPASSPASGTALTAPEKAAIIITALPPDDAGSLLGKLGQAHIRAYVAATRRMRHVPAPVMERVIVEFLDSLGNTDIVVGPDTAREILSRIMSEDAIDGIVGEASGKKRTIWEQVEAMPEEAVVAFVTSQHPRASAILMSKLSPEKAAAIIDTLDEDSAERVIGMLEKPSTVQPRVLAMLEQSIRNDLLGAKKQSDSPDVFVGAVFDNLPEKARTPLMQRLEEKTPDFAKAVARRMFLFEDIPLRLDPKDMPLLTREIEGDVLATALAYASARGSETVDFFLNSIPKRMGEQITESIEDRGTVEQADGETAEGAFIRTIRRLAEDGQITLKST
jgi:flagellar motor switch protein FliG